ncbi:MAG: formate dehydrogenase accessory sulfurtransferase FdhD [Acidobacteriota bacterium]
MVKPVPQSPPSGSVVEVSVSRVRAGDLIRDRDRLVVELPLEIRFGPRSSTVLLRTPGHDEELVRGFLYTEGIIRRAADIVALERLSGAPLNDDAGSVIAVQLAIECVLPGQRLFAATSGCGACGKESLAALEVRAPAVVAAQTIAYEVLATLPDRLRAAQPTFALTGGLHAAALFTVDGTLLAVREDIGRHNAVDKLVGCAIGEGNEHLALGDLVLVVSGRLGYEIVQKAIAAGIPIVASVGAASSLAVELAERFGLTLATFLRPGSGNLFGKIGRVRLSAPARSTSP